MVGIYLDPCFSPSLPLSLPQRGNRLSPTIPRSAIIAPFGEKPFRYIWVALPPPTRKGGKSMEPPLLAGKPPSRHILIRNTDFLLALFNLSCSSTHKSYPGTRSRVSSVFSIRHPSFLYTLLTHHGEIYLTNSPGGEGEALVQIPSTVQPSVFFSPSKYGVLLPIIHYQRLHLRKAHRLKIPSCNPPEGERGLSPSSRKNQYDEP